MIPQLTPAQVQELLASDAPPVVLDVREEMELELAALPGVLHIPMNEVSLRLDELDPERAVVVLCHHGVRSMYVARQLRERGFGKVSNLRGGIDQWSRELDPSIPRY